MSNPKVVRHYKYKNIAAALAVLLLIVVAISTAGGSDKTALKKDKNMSSSSAAESSTAETSSSEAEYSVGKLTGNYKYQTVKNGTTLGTGNLVLVDQNHKYAGEAEDLESVYSYLFNKSGDQIMSTSSTNLYATKECFEQFNKMISDFYIKTKLKTLMISDALYMDGSSTAETSAEESESQASENGCYEHETGLAIDLRLYNSEDGTYPLFTGTEKYSWIPENCWKYGFVLRYPEGKSDKTGVTALANHYRYVGKISAQIMNENNFVLEEYLEFIKDYTFENPYSFRSQDGAGYAVYYVEADKGTTTNIPIPLDESNGEYPYELSGNNVDGYILTVQILEGAKKTETSDDTSSVSEAE